LTDKALPEKCKGIYLGGGYPELYAEELSSNASMLKAVHEFGEAGGFIYGECGGFMYLCKQILNLREESYGMSGIFPFTVRMKPRLSRLGYRNPTILESCMFGVKQEDLHGHEFHYSELVNPEEDTQTIYQLANNCEEGFVHKNVLGGYIHLHFARSCSNVKTFITKLNNSSVTT
jgi:cobyrinic acid a,c-diamide synthase